MPALTVTVTRSGGSPVVVTIQSDAPPDEVRTVIQTALDQVSQAGGGTVTLSAGTFVLPGSSMNGQPGVLRVGSNTVLQGAGDEGASATVLKLAGPLSGEVTGIIRTNSGQVKSDGSIVSTQNVVIKDLMIDGDKQANGSAQAVDGFYLRTKSKHGGRPRTPVFRCRTSLFRIVRAMASIRTL